jgi:hypothetical protein
LRARQSAGNEKQLIAEFLQGEVLQGFIQAVSLKRSRQIVGEADDLQVERVGGERCGGNLAQRKILAQFANPRLHPGTPVVEMPDPGWRAVPPELEECRPPGKDRRFRFPASTGNLDPQ